VVDQTITGLAQGRKIQGSVLFLGGPLSFMRGLRERFIETLLLSRQNAVLPELAKHFVALGAAYHAGGPDIAAITYEDLIVRLESIGENAASFLSEPPLFQSEAEYADFKERHAKMTVEVKDPAAYSGRAYLGIDAGSTTTKVVLIDEDANILYRHYAGNGGSPLTVI
jgi:activator of 2-hydroxyglutaryl-CoA dehydratase